MAKRKNIGRLRHRLELIVQSDQLTNNSMARMNETFTVTDTVWGDIQAISDAGAQYQTVRNVEKSLTHRLTVRYTSDFRNRGKVTHIRHRQGDPFGPDIMIADGSIDDSADTVTGSTILATTGDEYNFVFTAMGNTDGNYFVRNLGGDAYSLHPTAQDATDNTAIIDLIKTGTAAVTVKKVLEQQQTLYEVMNVVQSDHRSRFIIFKCRDIGQAETFNIV